MGILTKLISRFSHPKSANSPTPAANPAPKSPPPVQPQSSQQIVPAPIKSLAELEAEMLQVRNLPEKPHRSLGQAVKRWTNKLVWIAVLLGIPAGCIYVANLPYPAIRRPIAEKFPVLLLPSYLEMDRNYKKAIATFEQSKQLIDGATSPEDLDLGQQKLQESKTYLDALPTWFVRDWVDYKGYSWWYNWRFTPAGLQSARVEVGQLEAKVFQEKNAQNALVIAEQGLSAAKNQYQLAKTPIDRRLATNAWQSAIDRLEQIPSLTLAGKTAQQKLPTITRDFQETVGLAAGNQRISTLIAAAQEYAKQAAILGQNPPHAAAKWREIEGMWQEAITRLADIPTDDLEGYAKAQKLSAAYRNNLIEIRLRMKAEEDGVMALDRSQKLIEQLIGSTPVNAKSFDRNRIVGRLEQIINELEMVRNGTTAYLKAQELKLYARNKRDQLLR